MSRAGEVEAMCLLEITKGLTGLPKMSWEDPAENSL